MNKIEPEYNSLQSESSIIVKSDLSKENFSQKMEIEDNNLKKKQIKNNPFRKKSDNSTKTTEIDSSPAFLSKKKNLFFIKNKKLNPNDIFSSKENKQIFNLTKKKLENLNLKNNLLNHSITERLRAKIIDWIIEVLKLYNQKESTIYKTIFLLDYYLKKKKTKIEVKSIHLIGATCIFIASKNEEVYYIKLNVLLDKILYNKFTRKDILCKELDILKEIDFKVNLPNVYDVIKFGFCFFNFKNNKIMNFFQKSCLLLNKMFLFSENITKKFNYNEIAAFSMILTMNIIKKLNKKLDFNKYVKEILDLFCINKKDVLINLQNLNNYIITFDESFSFIKSLKRFYTFDYN